MTWEAAAGTAGGGERAAVGSQGPVGRGALAAACTSPRSPSAGGKLARSALGLGWSLPRELGIRHFLALAGFLYFGR